MELAAEASVISALLATKSERSSGRGGVAAAAAAAAAEAIVGLIAEVGADEAEAEAEVEVEEEEPGISSDNSLGIATPNGVEVRSAEAADGNFNKSGDSAAGSWDEEAA